jgi:hypothetical protein
MKWFLRGNFIFIDQNKIIAVKLILFLFWCISCPFTFSQKYSITGEIFNKVTRETLADVMVVEVRSRIGTSTNNSGAYSLPLQKGECFLEFSHIGFEKSDTTFNLSENIELKIYLTPSTISVGEVTISADGTKDNVRSTSMGEITLTGKEMKGLPSLLGEMDPLKLLQLTPGIQSGSEGNTGFYVRGGGTDQNLILYDNTIVYNPGHLLGFFSVFNPDIIKDVTIIKSGIPAQYGGKLSSMIKLTTTKGCRDSLVVMGSIGLISSRIGISGPLLKKKGSFILAARKTYLELLVEPLVRHVVRQKAFFQNQSVYNFYDLNAGASINISDRDVLSFTAYSGRDKFGIARKGIEQKNDLKWGNTLASISWDHKYSSRASMTSNIGWTKYNFDLNGSQSEYFFGLFSSVRDLSLKNTLSLSKNNWNLKTGFELIDHYFIPNKIDVLASGFNINIGEFNPMHALEGGVFIDNEFSFLKRFSIAAGLRFSFFDHHGPFNKYVRNSIGEITDTLLYSRGKTIAFYCNPELRFVINYRISNNSSVKGSYMRIAQYVHLATSATVSLPTDIWIPSTEGIKPLTGDQFSIGYFRNFKQNTFEFSGEIYYKTMNNQLEFLRGIVYNSIDGDLEKNIEVGFGRSYGLELYFHKKIGKTTGWISYTFSKTELRFDNINYGLFYPAKYDRRHDLSITISRKINKKWSGSCAFIFISGNAFTMPIGRYIIQGNIVNEYGDVNSFRMPSYNRMDLSFSRKIKILKKYQSELNFSIYNLYNRANPYYIYFEAAGNLEKYTLTVRPVVVTLFPVIPSVSLNFNF